ncbi:ribulose-phosphate 3-epimerase, partial [Striga asiatica]
MLAYISVEVLVFKLACSNVKLSSEVISPLAMRTLDDTYQSYLPYICLIAVNYGYRGWAPDYAEAIKCIKPSKRPVAVPVKLSKLSTGDFIWAYIFGFQLSIIRERLSFLCCRNMNSHLERLV